VLLAKIRGLLCANNAGVTAVQRGAGFGLGAALGGGLGVALAPAGEEEGFVFVGAGTAWGSPLRVQPHFRWPQRALVLPRDQELMRLNLPEVAERRVLAPVGLRLAPRALTQAGPRLWSRLAGSHPATAQARRWRGFPSLGRGSSGAASAGTPRRAAPSGSRS